MGKCSNNAYKQKNRTTATTPPSQRPEAGAHATRRPAAAPPPHNRDDSARIRIIPDPIPGPASGAASASSPFSDPGDSTDHEGRNGSKFNSLGAGLRAKILFPLGVLETIKDLAAAYALQLNASTPLDKWLTFELARSSVQADKCHDQLQVNELRVFHKIITDWDDDQSEKADKLGRGLPADPKHVKQALERTKHGALYLLEAWTLLAESIESSGGLDEPQRQTAFDLLGIAPVHRPGCIRVPAGTDTKGLKALVAREAGRIRTRLDLVLNARSETQQQMAQLGIVKQHDQETRNLRSDLNRARRRFAWAMATLLMLQRGANPSGIIDPETGKPVAVGRPPSAVPEAARPVTPAPAAAAVTPTSAQAPAAAAPPPQSSQASPAFRPPPADCTEEQREMYFVAAGAILGDPADIPGVVPAPSSTA